MTVRPLPWAAAGGSRMSHADAVAVVAISAGVVALVRFADPEAALGYLLAFPIWIIAKDLGVVAGTVAAVCATVFVVVFGAAQDVALGPLASLGCVAVFVGAVATGARSAQTNGGERASRPLALMPLLTRRPEIRRREGALSRRELQVLEMIATGAKNAQIAERFVISQNTVKSHVSRILQKLPAANRTEAAFRYIELYGAPAAGPAEADGETDRVTAASAEKATVSVVRRNHGVTLTLEDGRELELPLPEQLREHVEVDVAAIVYFDQRDQPIGWYLPAKEAGVDLRHWTP